MLALFGFIAGIFALVWTAVVATIGLVLLIVFLAPLLVLALFFRLGVVFVKVAALFVIVCFAAACLF